MSLTTELKEYALNSSQKIPEPALALMQSAINNLTESDILEKAYKTGDKLPNFSLPNQQGKEVNLYEILRNGAAVISFYRGGWCPYCNLELKALEAHLPKIKEKGAQLIAITPETPDNSLSTTEKNNLSFEVLSDKDNAVAHSLNLVYTLPEELNNLYTQFGIKLDENQGNINRELPIAATYVVNKEGVIIYHFLEEDYKLRADPEYIVSIL